MAYFERNPDEPLFAVVPNDSHVAHDEGEDTLEKIIGAKYSPGWLSDLVWGFVDKVANEVHKNHPGKQVRMIGLHTKKRREEKKCDN